MYVRKYFKNEAKQAALELVTNLRREFTNILQDVKWMDGTTKMAAIEKSKTLTNHIGYPDELGDETKIEEYYKKLDAEPDNLFQNSLRLTKFSTDLSFGKLRKPVNKTDWTTHSRPAMVNAAYAPLENSIRKCSFNTISSSSVIFNGAKSFYRISRCYFTRQIFLSRSSSLHELWRHWSNYRP